jgi:hypothetical protein
VLTAVEVLATLAGGDLMVVDVGGATTDVYSILSPDPDAPVMARSDDVAGTLWHSRTVEGDLGVRWSAPAVVPAAERERLLRPGESQTLAEAAHVRADDPAYLPSDPDAWAQEARLAELAPPSRSAAMPAVATCAGFACSSAPAESCAISPRPRRRCCMECSTTMRAAGHCPERPASSSMWITFSRRRSTRGSASGGG